MEFRREDALDYHSCDRKGKIEAGRGRVGEGAIPQGGTMPSPLVKPDERISRIRFSRKLSLPGSTPAAKPTEPSTQALMPQGGMRTVPQPCGRRHPRLKPLGRIASRVRIQRFPAVRTCL